MKILAIRGKNLASIEGEFEVDFRKEPLCSAGIFAITGPTGSGKSTILDAMCIALYAASPRLERISDSKVLEGKGNYAVRENNIKTFLRRGKWDGYAEVDFKGIDGNEYRGRWSVTRSNSSPTGNINEIFTFTDLSNGVKATVDKREYIKKMIGLVGLTFEQFTRAVMLAQGNFSAFLKANENDKGAILQTLTGTEIYKRISEIIYQRNKRAKKELEEIEEKTRGLIILSDEEVAALKSSQNELQNRQESSAKEQDILKEKKEWLRRSNELKELLKESEAELEKAKKRKEGAAPRKELLARIDSVQEIRDKYTSLCNMEKSCDNSQKEIARLQEQLNAQSVEMKKANERVLDADNKQKEINEQWLKAKPGIEKATLLEVEIENDRATGKKVSAEMTDLQKEYDNNIKEKDRLEKSIESQKKELQKVSEWIDENARYETVIQNIPIILENINSANDNNKLADSETIALEKSKKELEENIKKLESATEQQEKLKKTLSSEIASLREKLVEGEPCPVCGSRNHEIVNEELNILEERILEKEKETVEKLIVELKSSIENGKSHISGLTRAIEMYHASARTAKANCIAYLKRIDNHEELLQRADISTMLKNIKQNWDYYSEKKTRTSTNLAIQQKELDAAAKEVTRLSNEIKAKNEDFVAAKARIKEKEATVAELLGNSTATAGALRKYYEKQIEKANINASAATEQRASIAESHNILKGQHDQKSESLKAEQESHARLLQEIENYISKRSDNLSFAKLQELLSLNAVEVNRMRNEIAELDKAVTTAKATKVERERLIEGHNNATVKPDANETAESLQLAIDSIDEIGKSILEELANIKVKLITNEENCKTFEKYKEEIKKKEEFAGEIKELDDIFGSAEGDKLTKIVQGYTLDILLDVANVHLKEITGRYELARMSDDSLGIKVVDLDMLSEARSVHSLSGGETFIVSLSLSLALSSISSNKMSIESLFIDEGFGALDSTTLKTVMSALERLQSQGRTIGVISHYEEMLEQIPVKVCVIKQNSGRSRIEIKEN